MTKCNALTVTLQYCETDIFLLQRYKKLIETELTVFLLILTMTSVFTILPI